jgi:catechol-2,3-dioxygenase
VGQSDHGVSLSLYAKDPDGLEFELFWTVPDGTPVRTRPLDLEREMTRRGVVV